MLTLKALHIIFVVSWFAGLFYMPRLFIYHTEALGKPEPERSILSKQLALMSRRLWYIITWPATIITLLMGLSLVFPLVIGIPPERWPWYPIQAWLWIKIAMVIGLLAYQYWLHCIFKQLQRNEARYTSGQLRMINEIATLLLFAIVFMVVLKSALNMAYAMLGLVGLAVLLMVGIRGYRRWRQTHNEE